MNKRIKLLILASIIASAVGFTISTASAITWGALKAMYLHAAGDGSKEIDGGGTPTNTNTPPANTNIPPPTK